MEQQRLTAGLGGSCGDGFDVLGVWRLANGRLERPKNRGLERKRQVALEKHRLTATGLGGTAKAHRRAWWTLPRRI